MQGDDAVVVFTAQLAFEILDFRLVGLMPELPVQINAAAGVPRAGAAAGGIADGVDVQFVVVQLDGLLGGPADEIEGGQGACFFIAMDAGEDGELEAEAGLHRLGDDFGNEGATLDFGRVFTQHEMAAACEGAGDAVPGIEKW